jgi:hypothetical protein
MMYAVRVIPGGYLKDNDIVFKKESASTYSLKDAIKIVERQKLCKLTSDWNPTVEKIMCG